MSKNENAKLSIVEVTGSIPDRQMRKLTAALQLRSPPTREEAFHHLQSMEGVGLVIERIPPLGNISVWGEVAFWSVSLDRSPGAALHAGPVFWHCDMMGAWDVAWAYLNNFVGFWGAEDALDPPGPIEHPPVKPDGQVWCDLKVQVPGFYLFAAQVGTLLEPPDYVALIECGIDNYSFGKTQLPSSGPQIFLVQLPTGTHRFYIKQLVGVFYFQSLTAWHIPISEEVAA